MHNLSHKVIFYIEPGWGLNIESTCPFNKTDKTRPCWPHNEDGSKMSQKDGVRIGCVYADWIDNCGIEAFVGKPIAVEFPFTAHWNSGEYFEFRVVD